MTRIPHRSCRSSTVSRWLPTLWFQRFQAMVAPIRRIAAHPGVADRGQRVGSQHSADPASRIRRQPDRFSVVCREDFSRHFGMALLHGLPIFRFTLIYQQTQFIPQLLMLMTDLAGNRTSRVVRAGMAQPSRHVLVMRCH